MRNFSKIHYIEVPFLQAQRGFGDRTFCVCGRVGMGCEVCWAVLAHCSTCSSTYSLSTCREFLKNQIFLRNLGLAENSTFPKTKNFPSISPVSALHPKMLVFLTMANTFKSCVLFLGNYRLWQPYNKNNLRECLLQIMNPFFWLF